MTAVGRYEIDWAPSAVRDLQRLPEKVATAVVEVVYGVVADSPGRAGHRLRFELEGKHSANRGSYRVTYEIDENHGSVTVVAIDHRRRIYRPR